MCITFIWQFREREKGKTDSGTQNRKCGKDYNVFDVQSSYEVIPTTAPILSSCFLFVIGWLVGFVGLCFLEGFMNQKALVKQKKTKTINHEI